MNSVYMAIKVLTVVKLRKKFDTCTLQVKSVFFQTDPLTLSKVDKGAKVIINKHYQ